MSISLACQYACSGSKRRIGHLGVTARPKVCQMLQMLAYRHNDVVDEAADCQMRPKPNLMLIRGRSIDSLRARCHDKTNGNVPVLSCTLESKSTRMMVFFVDFAQTRPLAKAICDLFFSKTHTETNHDFAFAAVVRNWDRGAVAGRVSGVHVKHKCILFVRDLGLCCKHHALCCKADGVVHNDAMLLQLF
jgi:hypothetical protein